MSDEKKKKLIFSEKWTDEKLATKLRKDISDCFDERQQDHEFILPPSFRNGQINLNIVKKWMNARYVNRNRKKVIGHRAIRKGILFLSEDQNHPDDGKDYDTDTDMMTGLCLLKSLFCTECNKSKCESEPEYDLILYTCCDAVYPLKKSWFNNSHKNYCEDCRNFFIDDDEENKLNSLLLPLFPKDLVPIILSYLPMRPSILTMIKCFIYPEQSHRKKDGRGRKVRACICTTVGSGSGYDKVDDEVRYSTSALTAWLPFFQEGDDDDNPVILFVNCNPDSKFYSKIFSYQHNGLNNEMIDFNFSKICE
jgi:hypothetical protein